MKAINFRAWDKNRKAWLRNNEFTIGMNGKINLELNCESEKESDIILMQFTNKKDKNGKEIWEGDIVSWGEQKGGLWIDQVGKIEVVNDKFYALTGNADLCEVVGNIYENPELLEVVE